MFKPALFRPSLSFLTISLVLGAVIGCNTLPETPTGRVLDYDALNKEYFGDELTANAVMTPGGSRPFAALSKNNVPIPTNSAIINPTAAVQLGKAFFWDIQVGGDGRTACATCHFKGGADSRTFNIVAPYKKPDGSLTFENTVSAVNQNMDFNRLNEDRSVGQPPSLSPFASLTLLNPDSRDHRFINYAAFGSPGVVNANFNSLNSNPAVASDNCTSVYDPIFQYYRQVTGRNAPSAVGAIFNRVQFWDGRASATFNGLNPFGFTSNNTQGSLTNSGNSSLASLATGPINNEVEMSCKGRGFHGQSGIGAKLLARKPLQFQKVASDDSVLGGLAEYWTNGLKTTYPALISSAFRADVANNASTKFSQIWGEAIQAYMATLVPDQTPFDRWLNGAGVGFIGSMSQTQLYGFEIFSSSSRGNCMQCHAGSELTDASVSAYQSARAAGKTSDDDGTDLGFHNIGNTPPDHISEFGRASKGPGGVAFSENGSIKNLRAFKTPGLRNIKLNGPYFHNGRAVSLHDVVDFYEKPAELGFLGKDPQVSPRMKTLSLSSDDHYFLEDFLTNALTDCRVENEKAPFDHPSLPLPLGNSSGGEVTLSVRGASGNGATCN